MTTQTTTHDELCPGCDQGDSVYWLGSIPDLDSWACRHCGTEWTIAVDVPRPAVPGGRRD